MVLDGLGSIAITIRVHSLSDEEAQELVHIVRLRTLGARLIRRSQIVQHAVDGLDAPEVTARMGLCGTKVRFWLKRFNARGLAGLEGDMRSGQPATYTAEEHSTVIAAALICPFELDLLFAS